MGPVVVKATLTSVLGVPCYESVFKEAADIVRIRSQAAALEDMNRETCDGGGQESAGVMAYNVLHAISEVFVPCLDEPSYYSVVGFDRHFICKVEFHQVYYHI